MILYGLIIALSGVLLTLCILQVAIVINDEDARPRIAWRVMRKLIANIGQDIRQLRSSLPQNEQKLLEQPRQTDIVLETPAERDRAWEPSMVYDMKIMVEKPYLRIITTERISKILATVKCLENIHWGRYRVGDLYDFDEALTWITGLSRVKVLIEYADMAEWETESNITCRFCNTSYEVRPVDGVCPACGGAFENELLVKE